MELQVFEQAYAYSLCLRHTYASLSMASSSKKLVKKARVCAVCKLCTYLRLAAGTARASSTKASGGCRGWVGQRCRRHDSALVWQKTKSEAPIIIELSLYSHEQTWCPLRRRCQGLQH